jgi:hypothetical protein
MADSDDATKVAAAASSKTHRPASRAARRRCSQYWNFRSQRLSRARGFELTDAHSAPEPFFLSCRTGRSLSGRYGQIGHGTARPFPSRTTHNGLSRPARTTRPGTSLDPSGGLDEPLKCNVMREGETSARPFSAARCNLPTLSSAS